MFELEKETIVIADFHIKTFHLEQKNIINFFNSVVSKYNNLIILGDFFEFFYSFPHVFPAGYFDILTILKRFSESMNVFYIEGNHDFGIKNFFNIKVFSEKFYFKVNNKNFLAIHGDTVNKNDIRYIYLRKFLRSSIATFLFDNLPPYIILKISEKFSKTSKNYLRKPIDKKRHFKLKNIFEQSEILNENFEILISGHFHENFEFRINNKHIYLLYSKGENFYNYIVIDEKGEIEYKKWNLLNNC